MKTKKIERRKNLGNLNGLSPFKMTGAMLFFQEIQKKKKNGKMENGEQ